ncbi:hypothetical protein KH5_15960 [Urechidicola sp. KH5]
MNGVRIHIMIALLLLCNVSLKAQIKEIEIQGKVIDGTEMGLPYVAISIPSLSKGTSTNEDGKFLLSITEDQLNETLEISSIGFKTYTITIQDYLNAKNFVILLEEDVATLDEVTLTAPSFYVKNALKNIKYNYVSEPHQLDVLYRRFSSERGKAKFFIEHYLKAEDRGPNSSSFDNIEVLQARQSADYSMRKTRLSAHAINTTARINPLRSGLRVKSYKWIKTDDTTYDGEDVIVVEGKKGKKGYLRLYIGMDTYSVYKIETSDLNAVYIYKKNTDGKLYLSYHKREWTRKLELTDQEKMYLKIKNDKINISFRHELIVMGITTDKKEIDAKSTNHLATEMKFIKVPYDEAFWSSFVAPPPTAFHLKSIKELESIYDVPIQTQFDAVNK